MKIEKKLAVMILLGFLTGCQSVAHKPAPRAEDISALRSMTQGLTNQPVTQEQFKNLAVQAARDPQAQSAIHSIGTALSPEHTVKYCPEDGQRYSAQMTYCPDGRVKLEWVE